MASATERREDGYIAEELRVERERSQLDIEELTYLLDGGEMFTKRRRAIVKLVVNDPLFNQDDKYFLSNEEAFDNGMMKSVRYVEILKEMGPLNRVDNHFLRSAINEELPVALHFGMFVPTIEGQGTKEQKAKWLPLAKNFDIIGAYAQTEMGHGTYVRGLETTATYYPFTEEFVINSPNLTSIKWWPGTLGHTATHAIVIARLITKGQDQGVHPFIVQIRSLEDHKPLPGIEVGDIGPKFGYFGMDNGFLKLTNIRIPRNQMLMRYSQVSPDGTYSKPPTDKITYGTMVMIRAGLTIFVAKALARAVTIAIRYSVVRRQTQHRPGEPETQVMDYQTQQYKLLPVLATAYAMSFAGLYMMKKHVHVTIEIAEGNLDSLPEHHATSAGLKAFSTESCCQGMELCRLSCGGHGYSQASGIPDIYANYSSSQTYEGENTVMLLQTARYLHKVFNQKLPQSQLPGDVSYLASDFHKHIQSGAVTSQQFSDPHLLLEAYRQRARRLVEIASRRYQDGTGTGMDNVAAWNYSSVDWTVAARAHCHYAVLNAFQSALQTAEVNDNNLSILRALCSLYAVFGIVQYSGEFTMDGYLSTDQLSKAREHLYFLLHTIRQEAVPLVDAFDFHDQILNSALGRYDGDVYRHLYEWALRAPRNKTEVHETYKKYLQGVLKKNKPKL